MKKLIPAICMLLVAASLLGTSTYAWFSMNTTVTATGMQVSAKSDSLFLEISGANDSGNYGVTGTSNVNAQLLPVSHETWSTKADITKFDLNSDSTNDNWYFQYSDKTDDPDSILTAKSYITAFDGYVASTTFSVQLDSTSGQTTAYDLIVSDITIPANKGIHVVIVGADGYKEYSATAAGISYEAGNVLSNTVTTTPQDITVYIWFDGNDANVYSDNVTQLTGAVSFKLQVFTTDHS